MFAVILISLSCYYIYTKGVCQYDHALPMLDTFCPVLPIPSVSKLAERSVILADSLITADVKAPSRFVQAKISLIELRMRILYSDIDEKVKNELGDQMHQLKDLIQDGADKSTSLLVSFTSTLDKLRMYTKFALEEFSQATSQQKSDQSKSSMARKLIKSYEQYLSSVSSQITRILHDAQRTSAILEGIKAKLETIQELNLHGEYISLTKIDELKNDWFWNHIFGSNKRDITKHERNLRILAEFMKFVNTALENANVIITKLKKFKNDAENLEQAELLLEEASDIPIHRHAHLLDTALERLSAASTAFEAKMHREIQSDETS
ncbi:unnamed protein product [Adineta ricciae]|uniref:Uncharacterized protein n=1 Tax=Adineta ricciae TaxID=249248 RepID=A0A815G2B5_ADIRI|nr:unnamed protein product [Adineta ricciae]